MLEETFCAKCTKTECIAMCHGCEQSFCSRHFIKHRLHLAQQMDDLHEKYKLFQENLNKDDFEQPILSSIYAWERKSIRKIQEIAENARNNLQQWTDKTKSEVKMKLNKTTTEFEPNLKSDNYTELDLRRWTRQLEELRNLLAKPATISIVEDKSPSSSIRGIKIIEQQQSLCSTLISETNHCTAQKLNRSIQEYFVSMFGPCRVSEENSVVKHSSYRGGLSQITGINNYSSGKHSIQFLIEKKGVKNIFIGIHSSAKETSTSSTFDYSVHGWWNLNFVIINGESEGGDNNEIIQTGDKITLNIDCDNPQLHLEHHRTKRLVHLPIKLDVCPFPWKMLVRLLNSGDSVRILR